MTAARLLPVCLLAASGAVAAAPCGSPAALRDLALAWFAFGQARGQQDVLDGATVVGRAHRYRLPAPTAAERRQWRAARLRASAELAAARACGAPPTSAAETAVRKTGP